MPLRKPEPARPFDAFDRALLSVVTVGTALVWIALIALSWIAR